MIFISHPIRNRFVCLLSLLSPLLFPAISGCGGSAGSSDDQGRKEKIVFVSGDAGFAGINTIRLDGTERKLVFPTNDSVDSPTFSPDGTKIAFLSTREDCGSVGCQDGGLGTKYPAQLWLINADGTGLRQLTRTKEGAVSP